MPSKTVANDELASAQLVARTDGRTNERPNHLPETSLVSERARTKWVIRKRWSHMWGSPGTYWRVSHPSIPQGRPLHGSVHLNSFEDALAYVLARIEADEVSA